jgi:hypothetical protein
MHCLDINKPIKQIHQSNETGPLLDAEYQNLRQPAAACDCTFRHLQLKKKYHNNAIFFLPSRAWLLNMKVGPGVLKSRRQLSRQVSAKLTGQRKNYRIQYDVYFLYFARKYFMTWHRIPSAGHRRKILSD